MSILLDFTDAKFDALTGTLCIKLVNLPMVRQWLLREYKDGATYTAEIKRFRKRRSKNANDLCWAMCEQLADAIRSTKEEVYRDQIRKVGVYKDFHLPPDEAKTFRAAWAQLGPGAVHQNHEVDLALKQAGQMAAMEHYGWTDFDFIREFGRNSL